MLFKIADINNQSELFWENIFQIEEFPEFSRLIIGCKSKEIPLVLKLCEKMKGPFGVLHVLLVSRRGKEPGRYQTPHPLAYDDLKMFLYEHQEYFERDGRHHLWVYSLSGEGQFIFDNHNYIYAYGDLQTYISILTADNFRQGEIKIPSPHCHNYHVEFDVEEELVNNAFEWIFNPLHDSDDP